MIMPRKFRSIFFWFDGSFTNSIASYTIGALRPELCSAEKVTFQQILEVLHEDLAIGKIDAHQFWIKAIEACQVPADPNHVVQQILENAKLNQPFFDIYNQIPPEHDPHVIVDIPETWFMEFVKLWRVSDAFPAERLIFTETFKLERILPDIANAIPQAAGRTMEDCFLVDPQQMRAVALHKLGLVSTAFVYPRRLKIDLALQGIWNTTEDVYHPKAGARTAI
jgi:hypothetical protein